MWGMDKSFGKNFIYMAFDFGTKKIGIAVGQTITLTARPLHCLSAQKGPPVFDQIRHLIQQWQPHALVVGIPTHMDGTFQLITYKAKEFAGILREKFNLPVYETDERLTTVEAKQLLFDAGGYKALDTSIDSFAAKLILEAWMREEQRSNEGYSR
jgi:putative holliday junction resolvase